MITPSMMHCLKAENKHAALDKICRIGYRIVKDDMAAGGYEGWTARATMKYVQW